MNKLTIAAIVTAVLSLIISCVTYLHASPKGMLFGASNPNCVSGSVTCYGDTLVQALWVTGIEFLAGNTTTPPTTATSLGQVSSVGSCAVATSSAAVITNPFAATSTVTVEVMALGFNATSTTINIGTTTLTSGLTSSSPGSTLAVSALQATATQATLISGQTTGIGSGQISAGSGSVSKIVVGPSENIGIFATSTYGNSGAVNYTPSSCTYKVLWRS